MTGATGFIGDVLVKEASSKGHKVIQLSHSGKIHPDASQVFKWSQNLPTKHEVGEQITVIHLGGITSFYETNKKRLYLENVEKTKLLASWCLENNFKMIYVSTIGVLDRRFMKKTTNGLNRTSKRYPKSHYGKSKLEAEKIMENFPESGNVIIRLPWVYGENMRATSHLRAFANWRRKKRLISKVFWPGRVTVIHVLEAAELILQLLSEQDLQSPIHIGETEPIVIGEILSMANASMIVSRLMTPISFLLPFKLRVLLEDALVFESPRSTGNYNFINYIQRLEQSWEDDIF